MTHADVLSRNSLPTYMDENNGWLTARIKKTQDEDNNLKKIRELIEN